MSAIEARAEMTRTAEARLTEIALQIEQHQAGEEDYRTTLETLISVASRAAELFWPFENRSKTRADQLRVFESETKRQKARIFIAFPLRSYGQS
jgi:hypothetical protein